MDSPMPHPPPYPADDEAVTLVSAPTETRWGHLTIEQLQGADYALRIVHSSPTIRGRALEIVTGLQAECVEEANQKIRAEVLPPRPANSTQEETA